MPYSTLPTQTRTSLVISSVLTAAAAVTGTADDNLTCRSASGAASAVWTFDQGNIENVSACRWRRASNRIRHALCSRHVCDDRLIAPFLAGHGRFSLAEQPPTFDHARGRDSHAAREEVSRGEYHRLLRGFVAIRPTGRQCRAQPLCRMGKAASYRVRAYEQPDSAMQTRVAC